MAHPDNKTATWKGCFGVQRYDIDFLGKAAHAADAPEHGINALDAVIMLFNGVNAWREHLPENTRIHGIITDGGEAPNIVPEKASASFYLRAEKQDMISSMAELFENIAKGAALMTGCSLSFQRRFPSYKTGIPDEYLNELFYESAKELGMNPQIPENASRASTDFADVSHELPGIHVYFDITENKPYALHTKEFLEAAATPYAINQSFRTASALAYTAYRYIIEHKDKMH
jgi:metal-dependent amidase/aminoacylase/carboxypeptidase family protein